MDFQDYVFTALTVGLFAIALIALTVSFSEENETTVTSTDNTAFNEAYINLSRTVNGSLDQANDIRASFAEESKNPILTTINLVFRSILFAGQALVSTVVSVFNTIGTMLTGVYNVNPIVINTALAILVIGIVLAGWALYRIGR